LDSLSREDCVYNPDADRVEKATETTSERAAVIPRIPASTQKSWIREFCQRYSAIGPEVLEEVLEQPRWFDAFPQYLKQNRPELTRLWAQERLFRVRTAIERWVEENDLQDARIFDTATVSNPDSDVTVSSAKQSSETMHLSAKQLILRAMADMPIEELEELPIPFKYLRPYIQSDAMHH
jgi:hypothetical protein